MHLQLLLYMYSLRFWFTNIHQNCSNSKIEVTSAESIKNKMILGKHFIHFCYPLTLMFRQHKNSHTAHSGIPTKNSNHTPGQCQHLPS